MPYNEAHRDESWDLLEKAVGKKVHWVSKLEHPTSEKKDVEAILCVPRHHRPAPGTIPFVCELAPQDVLLLIRNECVKPQEVVFELKIKGKDQAWHLHYDNKEFHLSEVETVPAAVRGKWKWLSGATEYLPFIAVAKANGDGKDRVEVTALMTTKVELFPEIEKEKAIPAKASPAVARVFVPHA